MPEISRFYGIVIKIYFADHLPPHLHAEYGSEEALLDIETFVVIAGNLPARASSMVKEWASLHRDELQAAWEKAKNLQAPGKIAPLP